MELSIREGGQPHFHKKKMEKKCFLKEIFNLIQNGLVHPEIKRYFFVLGGGHRDISLNIH